MEHACSNVAGYVFWTLWRKTVQSVTERVQGAAPHFSLNTDKDEIGKLVSDTKPAAVMHPSAHREEASHCSRPTRLRSDGCAVKMHRMGRADVCQFHRDDWMTARRGGVFPQSDSWKRRAAIFLVILLFFSIIQFSPSQVSPSLRFPTYHWPLTV